MTLEQLRQIVFNANQELADCAAYRFPWLSVSAIHRETGTVILLPDGGALSAADMVLMALDGTLLEGKEPPVCDAPVHLALYRAFPELGSIVHPYSRWASVFAQLDLNIPTLGTIHADTFAGDIPTTYPLTPEALTDPGDTRIAQAIADIYRITERTPMEVPAVLVTCHGAYTFGADVFSAVCNAQVLDETAFLAYHTMQLDPGIRPMQIGRKCRSRHCG